MLLNALDVCFIKMTSFTNAAYTRASYQSWCVKWNNHIHQM